MKPSESGRMEPSLLPASGVAPRSIWQDVGSYPSGLGRKPVPVRFQFVIDCADPDRLARFWAPALAYELAPLPHRFPTWDASSPHLPPPSEHPLAGPDTLPHPHAHP